ncbi:MAG: aminopeptidase [Verrucomicrobiota bacterium]
MKDDRFSQLAELLTGFSVRLKKGEKVLIDAFDIPEAMTIELIRSARARGAIPYVQIHSGKISREIMMGVTKEQLLFSKKIELQRMKNMQAYIAIRGSQNIFESSDVSPERLNMTSKILRPVQNWRVQKTRWVVLRWPTSAMAQQARMSTEAFEDFYFKVCTLDYARMESGMKALQRLMNRTNQVHIKGPGTDLKFSIKKIGAVTCGGHHNIPDGEVYTAPVKDSVNGILTYNAPTVYQGTSFDNIFFEFRDGKIIRATTGDNTKRMNKILDSDAGARYIGEFSLGFNPYILQPMRDILFDEKIAGSFHFTPGQAYTEADNGNRSQVHWDLVCIQRKDYGGGEIYFDGKLIRKDGIFIVEPLKKLNPDYLLKKSG